MEQIIKALPYTIAALAAITILDSAGAVASRIFNFKYTYLAAISCTIYMLTGFLISPKSGLSMALLSAVVVGFYDSTVGWTLCKRCKANFGDNEELANKMTHTSNLKVMLIIAPFFAFIGYLLAAA